MTTLGVICLVFVVIGIVGFAFLLGGMTETDSKILNIGFIAILISLLGILISSGLYTEEPETYSIIATTVYSAEDGDQIYKVLINKGNNEITYLYFGKDEYKVFCADEETVTMTWNELSTHESYK